MAERRLSETSISLGMRTTSHSNIKSSLASLETQSGGNDAMIIHSQSSLTLRKETTGSIKKKRSMKMQRVMNMALECPVSNPKSQEVDLSSSHKITLALTDNNNGGHFSNSMN